MLYFPNQLIGIPFRPAAPVSYIRLLHAAPGSPPVDVYANGKIISRGLAYMNFTQYLQLAPGSYVITVYTSGQSQNPLLSTSIDIPPQSINTAAVVGNPLSLSLKQVPDPVMPIPYGMVMMRFVHLSTDAPAVDITLPDGTALFSGIAYGQVTGYIPLSPGTYTIEIRIAGTVDIVLYVPNISLTPNRFYSMYAVGLAAGNPPLQVLIPLDGNSYIKF